MKEHCVFENRNNKVTLIPCKNAQCFVNGMLAVEPVVLKTGCRVILGKHHIFRFQNPREAQMIAINAKDVKNKDDQTLKDWNFAQLELQEKQGIDIKQEMENKFIEYTEKCKKEKEEAEKYYKEQERTFKEIISGLLEQLGGSQSMQNSTSESLNNPTVLKDVIANLIESIKHSPSMQNSIDNFTSPLADHLKMLSNNQMQQYIFEDLKSDREFSLCRKILKKWKTHQFTSLRDDLWGM